MRKLTAATAALVMSGSLVLAAAPAAEADDRQVPQSVIQRLPAPLRVAAETPGTIGWDDKGPYIVWGNLRCRIHLFVPEEWSWAWGTGPCWF